MDSIELRVSVFGGRREGRIFLKGVKDPNEIDSERVNELVKEALSRGCRRVSIYVVTSDLTAGQVLEALRPVIKGHIYPSMSVWVLDEETLKSVEEEVNVYG